MGIIANTITSIGNIFFEVKKSRKFEYTTRADVIVVEPNGMATIFQGNTDEGNRFLFVPMLTRLYMDLNPLYINGKKTFIVASNYHGTINIPNFLKLAESLDYTTKIRVKINQDLSRFLKHIWEYEDSIIDINVANITGTCNLSLANNIYSSNFATSAFALISAKMLTFLDETPRRIFLISLAVALFFGMFVGTIIGAVLVRMIL